MLRAETVAKDVNVILRTHTSTGTTCGTVVNIMAESRRGRRHPECRLHQVTRIPDPMREANLTISRPWSYLLPLVVPTTVLQKPQDPMYANQHSVAQGVLIDDAAASVIDVVMYVIQISSCNHPHTTLLIITFISSKECVMTTHVSASPGLFSLAIRQRD